MSRRWPALLLATWFILQSYACDSDAEPDGGASGAGGSAGNAGGAGASGGSSGAGGARAGSGGMAGRAASGNAGASAGSSAATSGRGTSGSNAAGTGGSGGAAGSNAGSGGSAPELERFSFFVTSLAGLRRLSGNQNGFGGDLRHGQPDGLSGADKICEELAESSMPGAAAKQWRAFLSATEGPAGEPVHAIERIGDGPWYDRRQRLVAMDRDALLNARPVGAHAAIVDDLPNEDGVPNHQPDPNSPPVDNHHVLTGSNADGELYSATATCGDWMSTERNAGRPRVGFSWPADSRQHWISGQDEGGCGAGVMLVDAGGSDPNNPIVGSGGGYGAIYCFALEP